MEKKSRFPMMSVLEYWCNEACAILSVARSMSNTQFTGTNQELQNITMVSNYKTMRDRIETIQSSGGEGGTWPPEIFSERDIPPKILRKKIGEKGREKN